MNAYVGITDRDWFDLLSNQSSLQEVNFWRPSDTRRFRVLKPGELFLFKLHSPDDYIVGGGIYTHFSPLPISFAWESFGISNGARNFSEMRARVAKYRRQKDDWTVDYEIGCIILEQPFFLPQSSWIPVPYDWGFATVQGRVYNLAEEAGRTLWNQLQTVLSVSQIVSEETPPRYGEPIITLPRLGQGAFRVLVADAYNRRCAITSERTFPALDAVHIKSYSENGPHLVNNGLLLRRDLHALFDKGYVTITKDMHVDVSRRIKEEFENGRDYYRYHGSTIDMPLTQADRPSPEFLEWHNVNVFRG
ncbi:MAG: HNH endonuclease [Syntrophaceae bacterium]|nr:HNH endonuclease [Syntrophaceae bacterium]